MSTVTDREEKMNEIICMVSVRVFIATTTTLGLGTNMTKASTCYSVATALHHFDRLLISSSALIFNFFTYLIPYVCCLLLASLFYRFNFI